MKQYLIYAHDFTDNEAIERRMAVRPNHLEVVKKLKENNNFILGGAILNDDGKMIGSTMVLQFETEEEFQDWYQNEIYISGRVWDKIEVHPFRVANV